MSDFDRDCRRQLVAGAAALFTVPATGRPPALAGLRKVPLLAAIVLGVLVLAAAALAATRLIGLGAPVTASRRPGRERPSISTGIGIPVTAAKGSPSSARLLELSTADPADGLPWGMRVVRTTRGLNCVQLGRMLDGRLGVLGRDGEFNGDGLFHELPASALDPDTCVGPSEKVLYSDSGIAAAGVMPGSTRACAGPGEPSAGSGGACPSEDERLVAFGLLGPHAVSVSYELDGRLHTTATAGDLGAYLIVLRRASGQHDVPALDASSSPLGSFPIAIQPSVVLRALFRFGGVVCQVGGYRGPGAVRPCTKSLAHNPQFRPEIPRRLHVSVRLKVKRVAGGYDLDIEFTAPVAVYDASTGYAVQVEHPSTPACGQTGISGQSIERDLARGQGCARERIRR